MTFDTKEDDVNKQLVNLKNNFGFKFDLFCSGKYWNVLKE
jgi:hypothetical protein